jgi:multidrug efflux system outer membrane protein
MTRTLFLIAALGLISGCAALPQPIQRIFSLPEQTASVGDWGDLERWWERFGDPMLTADIDRAIAANPRLEQAQARIDESAQLLRLANQKLIPDISLDAAASRSRRSERTATSFPGLPVITDNRQIGLSASYELDLWGRIRSGEKAANERLEASQWARHAAQTSIAAQVAIGDFRIRTLRQQIALTASTIALADEALELIRRQRDAGLLGNFEYLQNLAERDAFAVRLTDLRDALQRTRRAQAQLLGAEPDEIWRAGIQDIGDGVANLAAAVATKTAVAKLSMPTPPEVPEGLPSATLLKRPDVREAEAQLRAASADVAAARAAFFPKLSLTGRYGYQSRDLADLLVGPARIWGLGLDLLQPLTALRITDAQVKAARARLRAVGATYVETVRSAFVDAGNAFGARATAREARLLQERREQELTETLRMATRRFDAGLTGALEVIDARRNLLAAQLDALDRRNAELSATIDIFRALGGGWTSTTASLPGAASDTQP